MFGNVYTLANENLYTCNVCTFMHTSIFTKVSRNIPRIVPVYDIGHFKVNVYFSQE